MVQISQSTVTQRCGRALLTALLVVGLSAPALAQRPDRDGGDQRLPGRGGDNHGDDQPAAAPDRGNQGQDRGNRGGDRASRGAENRSPENHGVPRAERADDRSNRADGRGDGHRDDDREHRGNDHRDNGRRDNDHRDDHRFASGRFDHGRDWQPSGAWRHDRNVAIYHGRPIIVRPERRRVYRDVVILRPYGRFYTGYGHFYRDYDAYRFLGLTAITFAALDLMSEAQQRALEDAQIRATMAPVGEPIYWSEGGVDGEVVTTREGHTGDGRYCREFQQDVTIGGREEQAYGTACQQPDGSWQVVDD
jgi:hypothetical protein